MSYICQINLNRMDSKTKWFDANKVFPPFDKEVLGYYEIKEHKYYEFITCEIVTENSNGRFAQYRDRQYNSVNPIVWSELPQYDK